MAPHVVKIKAMGDRANAFLTLCQIHVEGGGSAAGTDPKPIARVVLFHLAEAASQMASALSATNDDIDLLLYTSHRSRLLAGVNLLIATFDRLMTRWGWPRAGTWSTWWADFFEGLVSTPSGELRFAAPGLPSFVPIRIPCEGERKGRVSIDMDGVDELEGKNLKVADPEIVADPKYVVADVTRPGGPAQLMVLTTRIGCELKGFYLFNPTVPTVSSHELSELARAVSLIETGLVLAPDAPAGPRPLAEEPPDKKGPNHERDNFIYNEINNGTKLILILSQVNNNKQWDSLASINAIRRAAIRFTESQSLPKLKPRKPGRKGNARSTD